MCQIFRNDKRLPKYLSDTNLLMSAIFSLQSKGAKSNKIFNFLEGCFSVMVGPMDMIFGVFSETNVRLIK